MITTSQQLDELAALLRDQGPDRVDALFDLLDRGEDDMGRKRAPEPIGEVIRDTISQRSLTAYRLAAMSGVSITAIQRWLNRERSISLPNAEKLAAALDLVLAPKETSRDAS